MSLCRTVLSLLCVTLSIIIYQGYKQQNEIFEFMINRSFNTFDYGVLCVTYPTRNEIRKFGKRVWQNAAADLDCSASIILNNATQFYRTLAISGGNIGLGEAYFMGYWSIQNDPNNPNLLTETIYHFMRNRMRRKEQKKGVLMEYIFAFKSWYQYILRLPVLQRMSHSKEEDIKSISHHYNLGNDFYQSFLGEKLTGYSCAIFNDENDSLEQAQNNKWDIIIKKTNIWQAKRNESKLNVLDVGCGWGYFPSYINNKTDNFVVGITISSSQLEFMQKTYTNQVANKEIFFDYLDYRDLGKKYGAHYFDRVVSIGMLEHVGYHKLTEFFESIWNVLKPDSYFLLHYITRTDIHPEWFKTERSSACTGSNYISRYIFPNGCLVHADWVWQVADEQGFVKVHQEFYGQHYAKTLAKWRLQFERNWEELRTLNNNYDEVLFKTYAFYFAYCESVFRNGRAELVQQLFYKPKTQQNSYTNKWDHDVVVNPNN